MLDYSSFPNPNTVFGESEQRSEIGVGKRTVTVRIGTVTDVGPGDQQAGVWVVAGRSEARYVRGHPREVDFVVLDTDVPPEVSVADADVVTEGGTLAFPVTLSRPYDESVTVAYTLGGTAGAGDYADATGGSVTFGVRETERTVRVATRGDHIDEADRTVTVTLSAPAGGSLATLGASSTATGTIRDDDLPVVTVGAESDTVTVAESAVFVLTRAGEWNRSEELTVTYCLGRTPNACSGSPVTRTFGIGESTAKVSPAMQLADDGTDGTWYATLEPGAGYRLGEPSQATVAVRWGDPN